MSAGDEQTLRAVTSFLERQKLECNATEQQWCTQLSVRSGVNRATINVYNTGKIVVGGKDSPLKNLFLELKQAIETGQAAPGHILPFEIDKFP